MEEEVIETSDAEELEEIRLIQEAQQNLSRRARFEPEPNSPRKRRKIHHEYNSSSPIPATPPLILSSQDGPPATSSAISSPTPSRDAGIQLHPDMHDDTIRTESQNGSADDISIYPEPPDDTAESPDPLLLIEQQNIPIQSSHIPVLPFQKGFELDSGMEEPLFTPTKHEQIILPPIPLHLSPTQASISTELPETSLFTPPSSPFRELPSLDVYEERRINLSPLQSMLPLPESNSGSPSPLHVSLFSSPLSSPSRAISKELPEKPRSQDPENISLSSPARPDDQLVIPSPTASSPPPAIPPEAPRYTLRQRQPAQLNPYEWDRRMYQLKLKDNPEAIVKMRAFDHERGHRLHHNPDDESESQAYVPPPTLPERRRRSRSQSEEQESMRHDDILPPLPDSDEEDMRDIRQEARKAANARKAQEEEKRKALLKRRRDERVKVRAPRPYPQQETQALNNDAQDDEDGNFASDTDQAEADIPAIATHSLSDDEDGPAEFPPRASSRARLDEEEFDVELKQTLGRMYPRSMFSDLAKKSLDTRKAAKKASKSLRKKSTTPGPHSEDQIGILPGQARKSRVSNNPRRVQDIRGDSESSDDDQPVRSLSREPSTEPEVVSSPRRIAAKSKHEDSVLELSSDNDGQNSDIVDDIVFDEDRLSPDRSSGARPAPGRIRRELLGIDFMLSRSAVVAKSSRTTNRKQHQPSDRAASPHTRHVGRTLKVVTRGARGFSGHQTVLDFPKAKRIASHGFHRGKATATSRHDNPDFELDNSSHRVVASATVGQEREHRRREKQKQRRRRMQGNGIYIFRAPNTHVVNGREYQAKVAVDYVDEDFHRALTPLLAPTFTPAAPPRKRRAKHHPLRAVTDASNVPTTANAVGDDSAPEINIHHIVPPCPDLLEEGLSFGENSCLRRGWLDDLLSTTSPGTTYTKPPPHDSLGFQFDPNMGVEKFTTALPLLYDRLTQWIVEPPDPFLGQQTETWAILLHSVSQHASWLLESTFGETAHLKSVVTETATRLLSTLEDDSAPSASIDSPILWSSWFTVEIMLRIGGRFTDSPDSDELTVVTKRALSLLVQYLWEFGLDAALEELAKLRDGAATETTGLEASQLWVCLIHLVNRLMPHEAQSNMKNPIWKMAYQHVSQSLRQVDMSVDNSEKVWHAIFSLCALSQFSTTGTSTSSPNLGACWEFPILALKHIRLIEDVHSEKSMNFDSVLQRDKYIAVVVSRCFHLRSRWGWSLDDARGLFRLLASIYQSRKFANLLHEEAEYPDFVWESPLMTLNEYRPTDTAYVLFLKLVAQAIQSAPRGVNSPISKQYLSLVLPSASLAFPADSEPTLAQMSMLYNRYCANFLIMCLDPSSHESQMAAMRRTVSFTNAHPTTQKIIILGLRYFGRFTLKERLPFDECLRWLDDIVNGLKLQENQVASQEVTLTIMFAIGAIKKLFDVYPTLIEREYPHGELLALADKLGSGTFMEQSHTVMYQALFPCYQSFLLARRAYMPPPRLPVKDDDSQDEFADWDLDIDMADPTTIAALDDVGTDLKGIRSDKALGSLDPRRFFNKIVRVFTSSTKKVSTGALEDNAAIFQETRLVMENIAGFIDAMTAGRISSHDWRSSTANAPYMRHANERLEGYIRYRFSLEIVKCNYHYYQDCMEFCVESLIWSLVGDDDEELELVNLLLPINRAVGMHALLENLETAEGEDPRTSYFRKLTENLKNHISNDVYVGYFVIAFRRMQRLSQGALKQSQRHSTFCINIGRIFLDNATLAHHPRFESSGYTSWFTRLLDA